MARCLAHAHAQWWDSTSWVKKTRFNFSIHNGLLFLKDLMQEGVIEHDWFSLSMYARDTVTWHWLLAHMLKLYRRCALATHAPLTSYSSSGHIIMSSEQWFTLILCMQRIFKYSIRLLNHIYNITTKINEANKMHNVKHAWSNLKQDQTVIYTIEQRSQASFAPHKWQCNAWYDKSKQSLCLRW